MMKKTIIIENSLWCELHVSENVCFYTFYPSHIPIVYGGEKDADERKGFILCESNEDADVCLQAIVSLIENGYGEKCNWLSALDMEDIIKHIFCGFPLRYLHQTSNDLRTEDFPEKLRDSRQIFAYFHLPHDFGTEKTEKVLAQIAAVSETQIWQQISFHSQNILTLDLWY